MKRLFTLLFALAGCALTAQTLDSLKAIHDKTGAPLNSDRPGATYNASTVGKGVLMTQMGLELGGHRLYKWDVSSSSVKGAIDLRFGLTDKLEVGSFISGYSNNIQAPIIEDQTRNTSSYSLNLRYNIFENKGGNLGVLADAAYGHDRQDNYMTYSVKALYSYSFNKVVGISSNLGYNHSEGDNWANYTLNLGFGLYDDFGFYFETYGNISNSTDEIWIDSGVWFLVDPNIQLDLFLAKGFNNNVQDYFGAVGVTWRILEGK